jgi:hypothetical protein
VNRAIDGVIDKIAGLVRRAGGQAQGQVLAAYRGIHFKVIWDAAAYQEALVKDLVGKPTFSAAAMRMAGSTKPDGSDVAQSVLEDRARVVTQMVTRTRNPRSVEQWWKGTAKMQFESEYLALLQRYVNTYAKFAEEVRNPASNSGKFLDIPFISTSKKAIHSARYAKGEKFVADAEKRTKGIVGRLFVYLFSVRDIQAQNPANIAELSAGKKIKLKARLIHEGEVTFSGSIPGKNLASQHDATGLQSSDQVAATGEQSARNKAAPQGGLREW